MHICIEYIYIDEIEYRIYIHYLEMNIYMYRIYIHWLDQVLIIHISTTNKYMYVLNIYTLMIGYGYVGKKYVHWPEMNAYMYWIHIHQVLIICTLTRNEYTQVLYIHTFAKYWIYTYWPEMNMYSNDHIHTHHISIEYTYIN